MSRLEESIEQLYTAFADIPRPRHIDGCPCCITECEIETLLTRDLREIAPEELSTYASCALLTVGSVDDYLYYLPRILHLHAMDEFWWPDPEVTGSRIHDAEPHSWSAVHSTGFRICSRLVMFAPPELKGHGGPGPVIVA